MTSLVFEISSKSLSALLQTIDCLFLSNKISQILVKICQKMFSKISEFLFNQRNLDQATNESINNFLIDYYLDCITRRHERNRIKYLIIKSINYFTLISYLVCISTHFMGFIFKLKYETKLLLFDVSMFLGGIEMYNRIMLLLALIFGVCFNIKLRLKKTKVIEEWTQLFQLIRSRVRPLFLVKGSDYTLLYKMIRAAKLTYPLITLWCILICKLSGHFLLIFN